MKTSPEHKQKQRKRRPDHGTPRRVKRPADQPAGGPLRLNRFIAQAGICSRRKADELIANGKVKVNGRTIDELGVRVSPSDVVEVNGRRITPQALDYFLLNKPANVITTRQDEKGRTAVLDLLDLPDKEQLHLYPVGRLDRNSVGVLLITNDGELAHRLMHPRYAVEKLYLVRTKEPVKPHQLAALRDGVDIEDGKASADEARYLSPDNHREIGMRLHEGRNRQIRRMLEALGHEVVYLERVNYAGLTAGGLRRGKWRRLRPAEVKKLKRLVKLA